MHITVSDSWSSSRRKKSTAPSGVGYFVTINRLPFVNDYIIICNFIFSFDKSKQLNVLD